MCGCDCWCCGCCLLLVWLVLPCVGYVADVAVGVVAVGVGAADVGVVVVVVLC